MTAKNAILAIDAACGPCSVAVWKDGHVATYLEDIRPTRQSQYLLPMIEAAMATCGITYNDLTAIASTVGPGSFTGIRVGLATASGLCFAARKPALGFTTLATVAHGAQSFAKKRPVLAVLNAGKGEVYFQAFANEPAWRPLYEPALGTLETALASITVPAVLAGNVSIIRHGYDTAPITFPRADALATLAATHSTGAVPFTPFYIREPDAKPMMIS